MNSKPDIEMMLVCPKCKQEIDHLIDMRVCISLIETSIIKEYWEPCDEKDPEYPMSDGYNSEIVQDETVYVSSDDDEKSSEYKDLTDKIKAISGFYCPKCRERISLNMDQLMEFTKYEIDYCNEEDYGKTVVNLVEDYTPKERWL